MSKLMVGAGKAQIQFVKEMLPTEGFNDIHDLPYAGVIALDQGMKCALVSFDLVMLSDSMIAKCREIVAKTIGTDAENVWVHVTHAISTPHEPGPMGPPDKRGPVTERHKEQIAMFQKAILEALQEAADKAANMVPCKMGTGDIQCMLNANRDVEFDAGWWINVGDGSSDHTLRAIKFEDMNGKMVAAILNYDMKPCTIDNSEMGQVTRKICADVPGIGCHVLEEELGAPVLYFMAAAADQVPRDMALLEEVGEDGKAYRVDKGVQYGLNLVEEYTKEFVADAKSVLTGITCNDAEPVIRSTENSFMWQTKPRGKMTPLKEETWCADGVKEVGVNILALGDTAFVGFKPEVCNATSQQIKAGSPFANTLLISMVNGGFKYMPDKSAYERVTWESQSAGLMPGAAEEFVKCTIEALNSVR